MTRNKMPVFGLTGAIGSGKTTAADILASFGGYAINADMLSHETILRGKPAFDEILAAFGPDVLAWDGEIDRKKLGAAVFGNREKLTLLEQIIHPRVQEETLRILDGVGQDKARFIIIDAPLLIEAGMHRFCDSVWLITAPPPIKTERVMQRDGLTPEEAQKRAASRRDDRELMPFADVVLYNDGDVKHLAEKIAQAYRAESARLRVADV